MNAEHEKKIPPPPLNQIPAADLERMKRDGLAGLCELEQDQMKRLRRLIRRVWYTFYNLIVKDGLPIIAGFFIFDADVSKGDFAKVGAVCSIWDLRSCIGLGSTIINVSDNGVVLLLLHELTHVVMLQGEHNEAFENYLNFLILTYNRKFDTAIENDYDGFTQV